MNLFARAALVGIVFATSANAEYDSFSITRDHPLCSYSEEACESPVVLNKYFFTRSNGDVFADKAQFIPGAASYRLSGSSSDVYSNADALVVKGRHGIPVREKFSTAIPMLLRGRGCVLTPYFLILLVSAHDEAQLQGEGGRDP